MLNKINFLISLLVLIDINNKRSCSINTMKVNSKSNNSRRNLAAITSNTMNEYYLISDPYLFLEKSTSIIYSTGIDSTYTYTTAYKNSTSFEFLVQDINYNLVHSICSVKSLSCKVSVIDYLSKLPNNLATISSNYEEFTNFVKLEHINNNQNKFDNYGYIYSYQDTINNKYYTKYFEFELFVKSNFNSFSYINISNLEIKGNNNDATTLKELIVIESDNNYINKDLIYTEYGIFGISYYYDNALEICNIIVYKINKLNKIVSSLSFIYYKLNSLDLSFPEIRLNAYINNSRYLFFILYNDEQNASFTSYLSSNNYTKNNNIGFCLYIIDSDSFLLKDKICINNYNIINSNIIKNQNYEYNMGMHNYAYNEIEDINFSIYSFNYDYKEYYSDGNKFNFITIIFTFYNSITSDYNTGMFKIKFNYDLNENNINISSNINTYIFDISKLLIINNSYFNSHPNVREVRWISNWLILTMINNAKTELIITTYLFTDTDPINNDGAIYSTIINSDVISVLDIIIDENNYNKEVTIALICKLNLSKDVVIYNLLSDNYSYVFFKANNNNMSYILYSNNSALLNNYDTRNNYLFRYKLECRKNEYYNINTNYTCKKCTNGFVINNRCITDFYTSSKKLNLYNICNLTNNNVLALKYGFCPDININNNNSNLTYYNLLVNNYNNPMNYNTKLDNKIKANTTCQFNNFTNLNSNLYANINNLSCINCKSIIYYTINTNNNNSKSKKERVVKFDRCEGNYCDKGFYLDKYSSHTTNTCKLIQCSVDTEILDPIRNICVKCDLKNNYKFDLVSMKCVSKCDSNKIVYNYFYCTCNTLNEEILIDPFSLSNNKLNNFHYLKDNNYDNNFGNICIVKGSCPLNNNTSYVNKDRLILNEYSKFVYQKTLFYSNYVFACVNINNRYIALNNKCGYGTKYDKTKGVCIECDKNNYKYKGSCYNRCPFGTLPFINFVGDKECKKCNDIIHNNECIKTCPEGYEKDPKLNICIITCNNVDNKNKIGKSKCYPQCNLPGYYYSKTYKECRKCSKGYKFTYNNYCVESCPVRTQIDKTNKLNKFTCINCLKDEYFFSNTKKCVSLVENTNSNSSSKELVCPYNANMLSKFNTNYKKNIYRICENCSLSKKYFDPKTGFCEYECSEPNNYIANKNFGCINKTLVVDIDNVIKRKCSVEGMLPDPNTRECKYCDKAYYKGECLEECPNNNSNNVKEILLPEEESKICKTCMELNKVYIQNKYNYNLISNIKSNKDYNDYLSKSNDITCIDYCNLEILNYDISSNFCLLKSYNIIENNNIFLNKDIIATFYPYFIYKTFITSNIKEMIYNSIEYYKKILFNFNSLKNKNNVYNSLVSSLESFNCNCFDGYCSNNLCNNCTCKSGYIGTFCDKRLIEFYSNQILYNELFDQIVKNKSQLNDFLIYKVRLIVNLIKYIPQLYNNELEVLISDIYNNYINKKSIDLDNTSYFNNVLELSSYTIYLKFKT